MVLELKILFHNKVARASVLGALGGARGPEEDRIAREQELARRRRMWRHGPRRCNVEEAGMASAGSGKASVGQGKACGRAQSGAGAAGATHMAGQCGGSGAQRNRGGGGEVDEGGLDCNFQKGQGPHCNA
jgi:hypothetical protein